MTAQVNDTVVYSDQEFSLAGINGDGLFEPDQIGLEVTMISTACWRGFYCTYTVIDQALFLTQLVAGLTDSDRALAERGEGPTYFGTKPQRDKYEYVDLSGKKGSDWAEWYFAGFQHPIRFTGGLLIADGFIQEMYVHMGFHPAYKYREVHELIFAEGVLQSATDRSQEMAKYRKMVADKPQGPVDPADEKAIEGWIEQAFSRDYRLGRRPLE